MLEGGEDFYERLDDFLKKSVAEEANYVIIGHRAFIKELGMVSREKALNEANKERVRQAGIRLCVRTKDYGAVQIEI